MPERGTFQGEVKGDDRESGLLSQPETKIPWFLKDAPVWPNLFCAIGGHKYMPKLAWLCGSCTRRSWPRPDSQTQGLGKGDA